MKNELIDYILVLLEDNITFHDDCVERTKEFVFTPSDKEWVAKHKKALEVARKKLKEFKDENNL